MSKDIDQYFKTIDPDEIITIVCHIKRVNKDMLFNGRYKVLVEARQLIAYFMRLYCHGRDYRYNTIRYKRLKVTDIGLFLNQDHSTVSYALKCVNRNAHIYPNYRKEVEMIDNTIRKFRFVINKPLTF